MDQSAMAEVYRTGTDDEVTSSGGNIAETVSVRGMISSETGATEAVTEPTVTATENGYIYQDSTMTITLTERYVYSTMVYVADIQLSGIATLRSGLAEDSFGRNLTEKTSDIADRVGAILAINGDFYGFRDTGYVIRNGILYRDRKKSDDAEDLVIYEDGSMQIIREGDVTAEELLANGALQVYSFGPGLVEDGDITVDSSSEVSKSMSSNPRTAIGMIEPLHYVMVVSDGRTSESEGLSLLQLATIMQGLGCEQAYNLDGGGSTTMYFNGQVINNPTTSGKKTKERSVSDIVYIGY
jgi:exopolysaccharide biosynthesis protein